MSVKETKDKVNGPLWVCIFFWVLGAIWHFLAYSSVLSYVIISALFGSAFFIVGALSFLAWYYVNK